MKNLRLMISGDTRFSLRHVSKPMNRCSFFVIAFATVISLSSQTSNFNLNLLNVVSPVNSTVGIGSDGRKYSGCWGYTHPQTNEEYAILGSCIGTYFINVSNPFSAVVSAFVPGRVSTSWREIKTYQNYCYVISDDPAPNSFQIIDLTGLPNSVNLVYDGTHLFERAHTLFIEDDKLYTASVTSAGGSAYSSMNVYSLQNPAQPILLRKLSDDYPFIPAVHDMFVSGDTVYASCGPLGLHVFKFDDQLNKFIQLGSFSSYESPTANHSSWITKDKKHLVFCDEIYSSPAKIINIENPANMFVTSTFSPGPNAISHNPYIVGDLAVIASYQDGLNIYNVSDPGHVFLAGSFDTYPEGGLNTGDYGNDKLKGNWGAYPFFPSGHVIATDINNGLFIFDITDAVNATGLKNNSITDNSSLRLFPNPAKNEFSVTLKEEDDFSVRLTDISGRELINETVKHEKKRRISLNGVESGAYIITVKTSAGIFVRKLLVQ